MIEIKYIDSEFWLSKKAMIGKSNRMRFFLERCLHGEKALLKSPAKCPHKPAR